MFFSFRCCRASFHFTGVEVVSSGSASVVSFSCTISCESSSSTSFRVTSSFSRSMPWLLRKKRPKAPLISIPFTRSAEFTLTPVRVMLSTSTFPLSKGHAWMRTFRLLRLSRVSGCCVADESAGCTTCAPLTSRFRGKRKSMRSTEMSMPVASEARTVACLRRKFCTGGM